MNSSLNHIGLGPSAAGRRRRERMKSAVSVNLESCFARLSAGFPHLEPAEQRVGVMLYRELARGKPVRRERVAEILGVPTREIVSLLEGGGLASLTLYDDASRIIGFGGLSVTETVHRFNVDGQSLFTWCAWDGLFIPEMLGKEAEIISRCPQTGRTVTLEVTPDRVISADPEEVVLSFTLPDPSLCGCSTEETIEGFCDFVHFFVSREAAEEWTERHAETFVLSMDDGVALARMFNASRFGTVLRDSGTVGQ